MQVERIPRKNTRTVAMFSILRSMFLVLMLVIVQSSATAFVQNPQAPTTKKLSTTGMYSHLATECVTAGCMAGLGDLLAQRRTNKTWDRKRSLQFIAKGLGEGMMWSHWYRIADRWVLNLTATALSNGLPLSMEPVYRTFISVLLDLMIACPLIYGLWDIPFPALMSGTPIRKIPARVKRKLGDMLLASIKVWTPVNILIYNVPVRYRVFLMSTADVFWQSIVSVIATREDDVPISKADPSPASYCDPSAAY